MTATTSFRYSEDVIENTDWIVMADGTALLLLDLIPAVVPAFGGDDALLERLDGAAAAARAASVPVIYVRVAFRAGHPEVSSSNQLFSSVVGMMDFTETIPATAIHEKVAPQEGDITVLKRRVSSFSGSDLDVVLRSLRIEKIVLAGVLTSGVVLSTVRDAADRDFEIVVLSDGCADGDPEVHRVLVEKVFPMQATVTTVDEWVTGLK